MTRSAHPDSLMLHIQQAIPSGNRRAGVSPAFPAEGYAPLALNGHRPSARMVKAAKLAARRFTAQRRGRQQAEALPQLQVNLT